MIYTVTYFNPLGNCDNVTHVEANTEVDAALIAHADFCQSLMDILISGFIRTGLLYCKTKYKEK